MKKSTKEEVALRLRAARINKGFSTAAEAAKAFDWKYSTYAGHENGDRNPNPNTLERYAKAFGVNPAELLFGENKKSIKKDGLSTTLSSKTSSIDLVSVIGEVAAGVWHEIDQMKVFETYGIPFEPDPRVQKDAYMAFEVRGPSINRQASDGDHIIAIAAWAVKRDPVPDDWIVAKRIDNEGNEEMTVKKVISSENGRLQLCPDSTDQNFQECIPLANNKTEKVEVFAYVTKFVRNATDLKSLI